MRSHDLRPAWRYGLVLVGVAAVLAARGALEPVLGAREPYVTFLLAVTLVAGIGEFLRVAGVRIALGVEVAARRDAERHARAIVDAANHAKDELLAMLGHELRNPLAAVRNAIAVAQLDVTHRDVALDIAWRQSSQLARLVEDLLDVARITRGTIGLHRERVRVDDVVARALDAVHEQIEDRRTRSPCSSRSSLWRSRAIRCGWYSSSPACSTTPPSTPTPAGTSPSPPRAGRTRP